MKDDLGQECVEGGILLFQGKTGTIAPDRQKRQQSY